MPEGEGGGGGGDEVVEEVDEVFGVRAFEVEGELLGEGEGAGAGFVEVGDVAGGEVAGLFLFVAAWGWGSLHYL